MSVKTSNWNSDRGFCGTMGLKAKQNHECGKATWREEGK